MHVHAFLLLIAAIFVDKCIKILILSLICAGDGFEFQGMTWHPAVSAFPQRSSQPRFRLTNRLRESHRFLNSRLLPLVRLSLCALDAGMQQVGLQVVDVAELAVDLLHRRLQLLLLRLASSQVHLVVHASELQQGVDFDAKIFTFG